MKHILRIIEAPDDRLVTFSEKVERIDIGELFQMFQLMHSKNAYGLSAPQVGLNHRFFVVHWGEVFVDPELKYHEKDGKTWAPEACLSLPGQTFMVERFNVVEVDGKVYSGLHARIIQHENDHLNGILISAFGIKPDQFETSKRAQ